VTYVDGDPQPAVSPVPAHKAKRPSSVAARQRIWYLVCSFIATGVVAGLSSKIKRAPPQELDIVARLVAKHVTKLGDTDVTRRLVITRR